MVEEKKYKDAELRKVLLHWKWKLREAGARTGTRGNKVANDNCPAGKARATVGQKTKNQQKAHWMLDELWSLAQIFYLYPS